MTEAPEILRLATGLLADEADWSERGVIVSEDGTGQLIAANDAACRLLGYSQRDIPYLSAYDIAVKTRSELHGVYDQVREGQYRGVAQLRRRDGLVVEIGYMGVRIDAGLGLLLTVTDPISQVRAI